MRTVLTTFVAAIGMVFATAAADAAVTGSKDAAAVAGAAADGVPPTSLLGAAFDDIGVTECADGDDDDGNGLTDFPADPFCASAADHDESPGLGDDDGVPECMNLDDDDGVEGIDLADPDCTAANDVDENTAGFQPPECSTPLDDDSDGDGGQFPGDPECTAADDDSEAFEEQCGDGEDDDGDGIVDTPAHCAFPFDDDEDSPLGYHNPAAIADSPLAGFPAAGSSYAILSTGNAAASEAGGIEPGGSNQGVNDGGHGGEVGDLVTLRVDLNVPEGLDCVGVDYRFLTDEEVDDQYNDNFLAELDSSNFTVANDGTVTAPNNFATIGGSPVGVHTAPLVEAEAATTDFARATTRQTAARVVSPGPHSLFFSIYDADDTSGVSAVFVDNLVVGQAQGATCVRDTKAPTAKLKKKPKKNTSKKKAKFKFTADEPATTFECKLNRKKFKPCTSPRKVKAKQGKNRFRVRAIDASGNVGKAVKYSWRFEKK
jgi:hypothetical protein